MRFIICRNWDRECFINFFFSVAFAIMFGFNEQSTRVDKSIMRTCAPTAVNDVPTTPTPDPNSKKFAPFKMSLLYSSIYLFATKLFTILPGGKEYGQGRSVSIITQLTAHI